MDKTILCIIRASTERQETESQKKELIEFCETKGFSLEEMEFIEVAGASAVKLNDKYLQMLEDIKATIITNPTIKNVALWHINRLGRVESKLHEMKEFFVKHKIQVFIREQKIELLDENGNESYSGGIVFSLYASIVKGDTDEMFAKMRRGRERNKANGMYYGGQIKYGYTLNDTNHFIINEDEAAIVRLIYTLYATGKYSIYKLVDELNSRGITKKGQKITFNIVRNCLADASYYNGRLPIIDKELFDKCATIKKDTAIAERTKESQNVNFAVGLLKCECGHNYIAVCQTYSCYGKVKGNRLKQKDVCDSPNIRRDILDELLWLVSQRLHRAFLMAKDTINIEEYRERESTLKLKVSTAEKEIGAISGRIDTLGDDYYINGRMTEAQYNKRSKALSAEMDRKKSEISNYKKELEEVAKMIEQLELPANDKYLEAILMADLDTEDIEDRKKIKDIMFQHIELVTVKQFKEGKHTCIRITIKAKTGAEFVFVYDTWLNCHRKEECCVFYDGKPLYSINGKTTLLQKNVMEDIEVKAGLPILSNVELGEAAVNHIDRELNISNEGVSYYTFIPEILDVKDSIEEVADVLKAKYNLSDNDIAFIANSTDRFEIDTPSDNIARTVDKLLKCGVLLPDSRNDIIPLTLGYGV